MSETLHFCNAKLPDDRHAITIQSSIAWTDLCSTVLQSLSLGGGVTFMELTDQFGNVVGEDRIIDIDEFHCALKYYSDDMTFRVYASDSSPAHTSPSTTGIASFPSHDSLSNQVSLSLSAVSPAQTASPLLTSLPISTTTPVQSYASTTPTSVTPSTPLRHVPSSSAPPQDTTSPDVDFTSSISSLLANLSTESTNWTNVVKVPSLEEALKPLEYEVIEKKYAMAHLKTSAELESERLQEIERERQAALEAQRQLEEKERNRLMFEEQMRLEREAVRRAEEERVEAQRREALEAEQLAAKKLAEAQALNLRHINPASAPSSPPTSTMSSRTTAANASSTKKSINDRRQNIGDDSDIYAIQAAASKLATQAPRPESDDEDDAWANEQASKARKRAQEVERKKRMEAIAAQRRGTDETDNLTPRRIVKSTSRDKPQELPRNAQFESSGEIVRISIRRHVAFDSPQVTFVPLNCSWEDLVKAISLSFHVGNDAAVSYFVLVDEDGDETSGHITDAAKFWKFYSMRYIAFDGMSFVFYENEIKKPPVVTPSPAPAAAPTSKFQAKPLRDDSEDDDDLKEELRRKAEARALERIAAQDARRKGIDTSTNGRQKLSVRTASSSSVSTAVPTPKVAPDSSISFKFEDDTVSVQIPDKGTWQEITDAVLHGFHAAKGSSIQKFDLLDEDGDEVFGSITTAVKYWKAVKTRYNSKCVFIVSAQINTAPAIKEVTVMCQIASEHHVHAVSIPEDATWETISACMCSVLQVASGVSVEKADLIDEDGDEVFGNIVNHTKFWKAYKTRYQGTDSVFVLTLSQAPAPKSAGHVSAVSNTPKMKTVNILSRAGNVEKIVSLPENANWEQISEKLGSAFDGDVDRLELVDADGDMMFGGITNAQKFWKSYHSRYVTVEGNVYIVYIAAARDPIRAAKAAPLPIVNTDARFRCRMAEERTCREIQVPLKSSWEQLEKRLVDAFELPVGSTLEHLSLVDEDGDDVFGSITTEAKFWKAYTSRYNNSENEFILFTKVAIPAVPTVSIKCQLGSGKKLLDVAIPEKASWGAIREAIKEQLHVSLKAFRLVDEDGDDVFSSVVNDAKFWKAYNTRYAADENYFVIVEDESGDLTTEEDDTSYNRTKRQSNNSMNSSNHGMELSRRDMRRETPPVVQTKSVQCTLVTDPTQSKLDVSIPLSAKWVEISAVLENRFSLPHGSTVSNIDLVDDDGDVVLGGITTDAKFWKAVNTRYNDNMVLVITFSIAGGLSSIKTPNSIYYRGDAPRQHRTQEAYHGPSTMTMQRRVPSQILQTQSDDCQSDISSQSYPTNSIDKSSDSMRRPRLAERPRPAPAPPAQPANNAEVSAFLRASGEGNIAELERFVQMGMDINAKDNVGLTAMHVASIMGRMNSLKWLLDQGAVVSSRDADQMTPLHYACESKHVDVALHLVRNGGDVSLRNKSGLTCLHFICIQGVLPLTSLIRDYMINVATSSGLTLLHCAADVGHLDIVEYLLEHGAQVQPRDDDGMTPLHLACIGAHLDVADVLIEYGSYWNLRDDNGMSPFLHACREGHIDVVQWLMSMNINMFARNDDGETALHCACQSGQIEIIKILLDNKLDMNARTKNGETPLEVASACGHDDLASWLEDRGCHMRPESEADAVFRLQVEEKGEAAARAFEAEEEINLQRDFARDDEDR